MSLDIDQLFESPSTLLRWAHEDVTELDDSINAFLDDEPYEHFSDLHAEAGYIAHKARITRPFPERWRKLASHALNDIRHAIDQAFFIACNELAVAPIEKDIYFPWARNPVDLERRLAANDKIPEAIKPAVRRCEPYPRGDGYSGGDDVVFHLRNLAGPNKHRVALQPSPGIMGHSFKGTINGDWFIPYEGWDPVKEEFAVVVMEPESERDYEVKLAFGVAFGDVPELARVPAVRALAHFGRYANFICDTFEQELTKVRPLRV